MRQNDYFQIHTAPMWPLIIRVADFLPWSNAVLHRYSSAKQPPGYRNTRICRVLSAAEAAIIVHSISNREIMTSNPNPSS